MYIFVFLTSVSGLEVGRHGTVCHTDTSLTGTEPYCHFFSEKYYTGMWLANMDHNAYLIM